MSLYRLKQLIWAIAAPFKSVDKELLNKYLNKNEMDLFREMNISEQQHCIRVCKDALNMSNSLQNIDRRKLAKIALLHDIGKIEGNLTVIDKSVLVVLDKITKGNLRKYTSRKKIDIYYNHPKKSLKILKGINKYDSEFLEAIEKHHYSYDGENKYLQIIKKSDDNN